MRKDLAITAVLVIALFAGAFYMRMLPSKTYPSPYIST